MLLPLTRNHFQELLVFPFLNQKMDFSEEESAHRAIHDILSSLLAAIHAAQKDHSQFKPEEMRELMSKFRDPLVRRPIYS